MKNIAVFVSGGGTNLQAVIDGIKNGEIRGGRISLVVSSKPDVYALERAASENIDTVIIKRKDFPDEKEFSDKIYKAVSEYNIDLIILAGFLSILSSQFIKAFENRIINVHPALIPCFCGKSYYGLKVHERVLERGVKISGATVHFVNVIPDGGPIILQKSVDVKDDDTPETLQQRVMVEAERPLLVRAVNLFCNGRIEVCGGRTFINDTPLR